MKKLIAGFVFGLVLGGWYSGWITAWELTGAPINKVPIVITTSVVGLVVVFCAFIAALDRNEY